MRAITGRAVEPERSTALEADLTTAHAIIHILVTRECGGETDITDAELKAARGSWLTTRLGDGKITVRAR